MTTLVAISSRLQSIRAGDIAHAEDFNLIGEAIDLLREDFIDRGLVCIYCDTINVARAGWCVKCGAPMGRSIPEKG